MLLIFFTFLLVHLCPEENEIWITSSLLHINTPYEFLLISFSFFLVKISFSVLLQTEFFSHSVLFLPCWLLWLICHVSEVWIWVRPSHRHGFKDKLLQKAQSLLQHPRAASAPAKPKLEAYQLPHNLGGSSQTCFAPSLWGRAWLRRGFRCLAGAVCQPEKQGAGRGWGSQLPPFLWGKESLCLSWGLKQTYPLKRSLTCLVFSCGYCFTVGKCTEPDSLLACSCASSLAFVRPCREKNICKKNGVKHLWSNQRRLVKLAGLFETRTIFHKQGVAYSLFYSRGFCWLWRANRGASEILSDSG